jgi:hypothetical protein
VHASVANTVKKRTLYLLILAVAVAVVVVALTIPGEAATRVIAVGGFFLALAKTFYDIWDKERDKRRKEDESRERIHADARAEPDEHGSSILTFRVNVYNPCPFDIHICKVSLKWHRPGSDEESVVLHTDNTLELPSPAQVPSVRVVTSCQRSRDLAPRRGASFYVLAPQQKSLRAVSECPADAVSVDIETHAGVVERIPGDKVVQAILEVLRAAQENSASQTSDPAGRFD